MGRGRNSYTYFIVIVFAASLLVNGNAFGQAFDPSLDSCHTGQKIFWKTNAESAIVQFDQSCYFENQKVELDCSPFSSGDIFPVGKTTLSCIDSRDRVFPMKLFVEGTFFEIIVESGKSNTIFREPEEVFEYRILNFIHSSDKSKFATENNLDFSEGRTRLNILLNESNPEVLTLLENYGTIETRFGNQIQLEIHVDQIPQLYAEPFVNKINPVRKLSSDGLFEIPTTEGLKMINAEKILEENKITGKNVKVAIIDSGFFIKNSKIEDNIQKVIRLKNNFGSGSLSAESDIGGAKHGTAVAEIITDIAPDVKLYLYSVRTEGEFIRAINHAMQERVDIISASIGLIHYPTNGNSPITKAVEAAIDNGIVFVTSAGNYALSHWEGNFQDLNNNDKHEFIHFNENLEFNFEQKEIDEKTPIHVSLNWYNSHNIHDFDLILLDKEDEIVKISNNLQKSSMDDSIEEIYYIPKKTGTYKLQVIHAEGKKPADVVIEIFSEGKNTKYHIPEGSIIVPKDANGALVVGAVNLNEELENFNSHGPTNNGIIVPQIYAPNRVSTVSYFPEKFVGTSASAPHVTGVVALLLEKDPLSAPSRVLKILNNSSINRIDSLQDSVKDVKLKIVNAQDIPNHVPIDVEEKLKAWLQQNLQWLRNNQTTIKDFSYGLTWMLKESEIKIPPKNDNWDREWILANDTSGRPIAIELLTDKNPGLPTIPVKSLSPESLIPTLQNRIVDLENQLNNSKAVVAEQVKVILDLVNKN